MPVLPPSKAAAVWPRQGRALGPAQEDVAAALAAAAAAPA